MNEVIKCNYCGNSNFNKRKEKQTEFEPYGEIIEFKEDIWVCKKCGDELNYTLNYTDGYEKAQKKSEVSSIKNMLAYLTKGRIKLKDIEDSLGLPVRTLSRWKSKLNYSKVGLTLLRVVRSYPWIILVAARRFESKAVDEVFKQAAMKKFGLVEKKKLQTIIVNVSKDDSTLESIYLSESSTEYNENNLDNIRKKKSQKYYLTGVQ
ncbi:MAG: hypothetical protein KAH33_03815 [Candidatus Delongbacteria bacterium]|nr:hypothetical protein [Candidatus Delongbacteria bacterium]